MNILRRLFNRSQGQSKPQAPRCSVCHKTSEKLMAEFRKQKPGVVIIDSNWVGICPECGKAYCVNHSTRVSDSMGDKVPACPTHGTRLDF